MKNIPDPWITPVYPGFASYYAGLSLDYPKISGNPEYGSPS
jgi:hypothetical protein